MNEQEMIQKHEKAEFGFWLYLMTDIMLFASLFATFMILRGAANGGVSGHDIFEPGYALLETIILLASSMTCGLALVAGRFRKQRQMLGFMVVTIILGIAFLTLELIEFTRLVGEGNSWQSSAFLSGFFTLVGTHGFHILMGLIWASLLFVRILKYGVEANALRKFTLFSLFWHFLDIVWIFIFSVVYLIGGNL